MKNYCLVPTGFVVLIAVVGCVLYDSTAAQSTPHGDAAAVVRPRWSAEQAWSWYQKQPWIVGFNTEWMARLQGSRWDTDLPLFKQEGVGCYSWGLVNGRTQCQFAWYHKRGTPEPKVWFHDLFHSDGRPYDPAEHESIRKTTSYRTQPTR
jgi:hypothetical protein